MIKEINQKTTTIKQQRTHHCSNNQEIMRKQRKNHETSDSWVSNNRNEDFHPSHKNYTTIYLIKGRFLAEIKHYTNRGHIHKNQSSNINEEISIFHVIIVILWFQRPSLSFLIASSVSSVHSAKFILSPHPFTYPTFSLRTSSLPSLPPLSEHNSLLSIHTFLPPLSLYQPPLTDIINLFPSFKSVFHRDFSSFGLQRKNPSERFIRTSKNHSFSSIIIISPAL